MTRATLIYAHRGANREAAENTRSAFERALHYAIDGMETDIQLSRDGVPVLWHDRLLGKLGMASRHIDDFDHAQLQQMDFAAHFAGSTHSEGIMSLREFITAYRPRTRLLLEIKNRDWEKADRHASKVRQTLDLLGEVDSARIQVSSFNLSSLVYANEYRPGFPLVYNFEDDQTLADARRVLAEHPFLHGLCLPIATLDEAMVQLLRAQGKRVAVYTCNSEAEIGKALQLGVDILISDVPHKALQMRDERH
ncbi:MAG TPA: glycerophosphodiester phosphodiesterase [Gallionellaceae bacterium]